MRGDDGVCAAYAPVHASPLEPGTDNHFATGFENPGRGTKTLGVKLRVAHASAVVEDVHRTLDRLGGESGMGAERVNNGVQFAIVQFSAASRCPLFAFAGCAEDRVSGSVQSFFGMVSIEDLSGLGKSSAAVFQIQTEPSPSTTQREASVKPRRVASRSTRSAKSDRSGLVSVVAAL